MASGARVPLHAIWYADAHARTHDSYPNRRSMRVCFPTLRACGCRAFFFEELRFAEPSFYFWEISFLMRRFAISLCVVVFRNNSFAQGVCFVYPKAITTCRAPQSLFFSLLAGGQCRNELRLACRVLQYSSPSLRQCFSTCGGSSASAPRLGCSMPHGFSLPFSSISQLSVGCMVVLATLRTGLFGTLASTTWTAYVASRYCCTSSPRCCITIAISPNPILTRHRGRRALCLSRRR